MKGPDIQEYAIQAAVSTIREATTEAGLLATSKAEENYNRVWARDSIMTGIAGLLHGEAFIIEAWRRSLETLQQHQHETGMIPSNVGGKKVSYGSLVGRVDATLWYIIGVALYYRHSQDDAWLHQHLPSVKKAMALCQAWEFNGRHLIYTPLSGNWADEYPIQGYTLYDNALRLWGLRLWEAFDVVPDGKTTSVEETIRGALWLAEDHQSNYHPRLYKDALGDHASRYWEAGFSPSRYYRMFDAAGNGLALLLNIGDHDQTNAVASFLTALQAEQGTSLVPAFWPVIKEGDDLYPELAKNYAYHFKNHPHHFHNGGIWPIMMGLLSMGLKTQGQADVADSILSAYLEKVKEEDFAFHEYFDSLNLAPGGKTNMCYSASGLLFMTADHDRILDNLKGPLT